MDSTVGVSDGSSTETLTLLNYGTGALVQKDVLTTSSDGRTQSLQRDTNGDGVFDHFETTVTNADGSITGTTSDKTAGGALIDQLVVTTSANGLSKSSTMDVNGDGVIDYSQSVAIVLNADGSRLTIVSDFYGNGTLRSRTITASSANGLINSTEFDLNGDGVDDEFMTDETVLNPDGTSVRTIVETYADGTIKSQSETTRDAGAYNSLENTDFDTNGDGFVDRNLSVLIDQDGYRTELVTYFNLNGTQKRQIDRENSPDGLSHYIWYGGSTQAGPPNEQFYFIPNANGSYLWNRFTSTTAQTATHTIDSSGVDHWVWADQTAAAYAANPILKTLTIDLATENKLIDMARRLFDTTLDRTMAQFEVQTLPKYISANGVLDTATLGNDLMASTEFTSKYGTLSNLQFVERIYQNALGRHAHSCRCHQPRFRERRALGGRERACRHEQHADRRFDVCARPYDGQTSRGRHHQPPL